MGDYEVVKSERKYDGMILNVRHDVIKLPNGKTVAREVVEHNGGAAALPVDSEGNIYLARQYRRPAGKLVLEVCAGLLEPGENAEECAVRELQEELGFKAGSVRQVCAPFYGAIGFCEERTRLFIATELTPCEQNLDPEEFITAEKYSLDDAVDLIRRGEIIDAKTIVAILAYKAGL